MSETLLPHAEGSEKFVLSSFMKEPGLVEEFPLAPEVFHFPAHRLIYQRMLEDPDLDLTLFVQSLHDRGTLDDVGGPAAITDIYTYAVGPMFGRHLGVVRECHTRRKLIVALQAASEAAFNRAEPDFLHYVNGPITAVIDSAKERDNPASRGFPAVRADDLEATEPARDLVEGLLTDAAVSLIYGASNVGKSFWILDLAAHVATGKPWGDAGLEVDQGAVVYVALEGTCGMRNRIEAMKRQGILTPGAPFFVCFAPVSLLDPTHGPKLVETVKAAAAQSNLPCRLVVIDTMARAMAGGNENAGEVMTAAVATIDLVRQATGAHIAIVHHCGKDEAKGARGHSSLRAAVDTEIEVYRPHGEHFSTVRVTKQRDLDISDPMPFSLKVVELGKNHREKLVTSCVVMHVDGVMASQPKKQGRPRATANNEVLALLPKSTTTEWQKAADTELGVSKSAFHRMLKQLRDNGAYQSNEGGWVRA